MKKANLILLTVTLLIGTISFPVFAAANTAPPDQNAAAPAMPTQAPAPDGRFGFGGPGLGPNHDPFARLNLTFEQQLKILEIRQAFETKSLPLRFEMEKINLELRRLWEANPLNQEAIEAKEKALVALKVQAITLSREVFAQLQSALTPEQQKQLQSEPQFKPDEGFPCHGNPQPQTMKKGPEAYQQ